MIEFLAEMPACRRMDGHLSARHVPGKVVLADERRIEIVCENAVPGQRGCRRPYHRHVRLVRRAATPAALSRHFRWRHAKLGRVYDKAGASIWRIALAPGDDEEVE
jgi:hypothetical protein